MCKTKGIKKCQICKRLLNETNQSFLCQSCYISVYQMMKFNKGTRTREECIKILKEKKNIYSSIVLDMSNSSKVYKGVCI